MKKLLLTLIFLPVINFCFAQPLFTYGKHIATKKEFVQAFNKNPNVNGSRKQALNEYLDLYIKFKLKVQAAYDAGLDKDATQQYELENFKKQIADKIINDEANISMLVKEAFGRSQKEIHLAQVFIEVPGNADTTEAYKKIHEAYKQLQQGKDFGEVSEQFSSDESTKQAKGDLGFISVFTLPYRLENLAYNLEVNTFSAPVKTKTGYHIFKNIAVRKSLGSRKVAQILIALPSVATADDKKAAAKKADSLYNLLKKGTSFEELVASNSNDLSSSENKGELPEFTTGTYSPDFEKVAFSLQKSGDISKPFETAFGFHILRLVEVRPAPTDLNDPAILSYFEEKVSKDERMEISRKEFFKRKLSLLKFKPAKYNEKDLFIFSISAILKTNSKAVNGISDKTLLFSFPKQIVKAVDWINFLKDLRNTSASVSKENYKELFQQFVQKTADEYYRKNLFDYNAKYAQQVKEFKEANLLFAVMEKNVWSKASADTAGLLQYYNFHKSKYTWPPSADAIVVTCKTIKLAQEMQQKLKDNLNNWREITSNNSDAVIADSGRFELGQLTVVDRTNFTSGLVTVPVKNTNDETYTFNYVIKVYNDPAQRSFDDARGMVITDYQQVLEDNWINELKKKYPVKVNPEVFNTIK